MSFFAASGVNVSIVAEPLFHVLGYPVTNSTLLGLCGTLLAVGLLAFGAWRIRNGIYNRFSIAILWAFELLFNTVVEVMGDREKARRIAPLAITIFFVVVVNNWLGVLPFVGPLTFHGQPFFRGLAADLNFTAALAVITMVTAQIWAIQSYGLRGNIGRYLGNPFKDPMHAFEGILELLAEFSRLLALAMRLFGNVFGGEVLLLVMGYITSYAAPAVLPVFMLFELFVGVIQAYVFFMLTVVFVSLGANGEHGHEEAPLAAVPDQI